MPNERCNNIYEYNIVMRYLMAVIVFGHFHRPAVASNMKIKDFLAAKLAEDGVHKVIRVSEHKTSGSGSAGIALEPAHYELFRQFLRKYDNTQN